MKGDKAHAAAYAWTVLKAEGAKTRLETLGNRNVEIGRDSDGIYNSLSPGVEDNILQAVPGAATVGSNKKYAPHFHAKRPIWAPPSMWPDPYWQRLTKLAADGLLYMVAENLKAVA